LDKDRLIIVLTVFQLELLETHSLDLDYIANVGRTGFVLVILDEEVLEVGEGVLYVSEVHCLIIDELLTI
jgi:hypothetical protein